MFEFHDTSLMFGFSPVPVIDWKMPKPTYKLIKPSYTLSLPDDLDFGDDAQVIADFTKKLNDKIAGELFAPKPDFDYGAFSFSKSSGLYVPWQMVPVDTFTTASAGPNCAGVSFAMSSAADSFAVMKAALLKSSMVAPWLVSGVPYKFLADFAPIKVSLPKWKPITMRELRERMGMIELEQLASLDIDEIGRRIRGVWCENTI